jgi:integrase
MAASKKNLRKRGNSWVVSFRQDGKQVWRSFKRKHEAEVYLANVNVKRAAHEPIAIPARKILFAELAEEWLSVSEHDRACSASTMADYRNVVARLKDAFGTLRLEQLTAARIERWRSEQIDKRHIGNRTANKERTVLRGIFELARAPRFGYGSNPVDAVSKLTEQPPAALDFYSSEEVWALVRAANSGHDAERARLQQATDTAQTDEDKQATQAELNAFEAKAAQDGALFLTAAFSGLRRGELIALRWRDVDFAGHSIRVSGSYSSGELSLPKWGKVRSVPMVDELAEVLAKLGQREERTGDDDLVFPGKPAKPAEDGKPGKEGDYLDGSALRRRYAAAQKKAGLRPLRFHDLRHVFGSLAIRRADLVQVQAWMGHSNVETTMRYLHFRPQGGDAALLGQAFKIEQPAGAASALQASGGQTDAAAIRSDAGESDESPANAALRRNEAERDDTV